MKKNLKTAFLGAGYMSETHAGNLMKLPEVELSCICDIDMDRASGFGKLLGLGLKTYTDFDKMISENDLDILFICIPPFAHKGQLEKAVAKGINIFIEKPIALDRKRAKSMVDAVAGSNVISQVGYHMRAGKAVEKLKGMIESGDAGLPVMFLGSYMCNSLHTPWWIDKDKSGGQVFEQAIHLYDMAMYLMGKPLGVTGAAANLCHKDVPGYTVEDNSASIIEFESGAIGTIVATNCAVPGVWDGKFTVVCENVTVNFTDANNAEFIYTSKETAETENVTGQDDMYFEEVKTFIETVKGRREELCNINEGYISFKMVSGVNESSRLHGKKVRLNEGGI